MRRVRGWSILVLPLLAAAAPAGNRGVPVAPGDRVAGAISPAEDSDAFLLPLTDGARVTVQVAAAPGSLLLPELALRDPSGGEASLSGFLRGSGRSRLTLRGFPVRETGAWAVVVRGGPGTAGAYAISFKTSAPRAGARSLAVPAGSSPELRFGASDGAVLSFSIRERMGPALRGIEVVDPSGEAVAPPSGAVARKGSRIEGRGIVLVGGPGTYAVRLLGSGEGETTVDASLSVKYPKAARRSFALGAEPRPAAATPSSGRDGTAVAIDGSGFGPGATVWFGDDAGTGVAVPSAARIDCEAPRTLSSDRGEAVALSVANPDGQEGTVPGGFRFLGIPDVRGASPAAAPLAGGITVTLSGAGFRPGFTLAVAGAPVPDAVLTPAGTISFVAAPRPAGPVSVVVTDEFGRPGALSGGLLYVRPPAASAARPSSSSFAGGRTIVLTGTDFRGTDRVLVGGDEAGPVTVLGATTLRFPMPAGEAGTFDVEVRDEFGQSTTTPGLLSRRGPFVSRTSTAVPAAPTGTDLFAPRAALGDLDGDGDPDLVVATPYPAYDSSTYSLLPGSRILLNDGSGAFADETADRQASFTYPGDAGQASALAVGDLDGDGAAEVVLSASYPFQGPGYVFTRNSKSYAYYLKGAYYNYQDYPTYPATRLLANDGAGILSDATSAAMPASASTPVFGFGERWQADASALGDLDGDGDSDLVLATSPLVSGSVAYQRYSTTTYTTYLQETYSYAAATRVLRNASGTLSAVAGALPAPTTSTGSYGATVREDFGGQALALGDLDGDGDPDLAVVRSYPRLVYAPNPPGGYYYDPACRVLANDGTGAFTTGSLRLPAAYGASHAGSIDYWQGDSLALGDLDGDGDLDLVVGRASFQYWYDSAAGATRLQPAIRIFRNDGTGAFAEATGSFLPAASFSTGSADTILGASAMALGDLDGDRSLDLVVTGTNYGVYDYNGTGYGYYGLLPAGTVQATKVFLNDGTGWLGDVTGDWMPTPYNGDYGQSEAAVLGDLDGDGDLDLVLGAGVYPETYGVTVGHNRPLRILENR